MGKTIYGYCENKGRHKLDTVKVSATQPTTNEKVWIKKGKNLFDKDNFIVDDDGYIGFKVDLKQGETYTMSSNLPIVAKFAEYGNENNGSQGPENWTLFTSWSFIAGNNTKQRLNTTVFIGVASNGFSKNIDDLTNYNIQIEQGQTATAYEAYVEPKIYVKNDNDIYEDLKIVVKDDFAVLTGSKNLTGSTDAGNIYVQTMWDISYPSGFSKENCIVIAFGTKFANDAWAFGDVNVAKVSIGNVSGAVPRSVTLTADNISVQAWNISETEKTLTYKIVLMKV